MDKQTAENIISDIVADLTDRRGLRQGWEQIDEDIRIEIFETWQNIILRHAGSQKVNELKPCPFCGSQVVIEGYSNTICRKQIDLYIVECANKDGCGARTGIFFKEKDATKAWNTRAIKELKKV